MHFLSPGGKDELIEHLLDENEKPTEPVNGAPAGDEGGPLTEDENTKQADDPVITEKFVLNGEEVGPEDVEFDSVADPTDAGTVNGARDEMDDIAEDPALYGNN